MLTERPVTNPATAVARVAAREFIVARRSWRSYVPFLFVQPVLFFGALGLGIGSLVDDGDGGLGIPYRHFAGPGLLMGTVVFTSIAGSLWAVTLGTTWERQFHGMIATPLRPSHVFAGHVAFSGLRGMVAGTAFLIVAAAFGGIASATGVLLVPLALLTALACSAPTAAYSATQTTDSTYVVIMRILAMPMFLTSGTTFPVTQLPGWLQAGANLSPLYHAVEVARPLALGTPTADIAVHLLVLVGLVAAGLAVGVHTLERALGS